MQLICSSQFEIADLVAKLDVCQFVLTAHVIHCMMQYIVPMCLSSICHLLSITCVHCGKTVQLTVSQPDT